MSFKSYRPKKKKDRLLLFLFVAFAVVAFFAFVVEPFVVDPMLQKAEASYVPQTEAEWEKELCAEYRAGKYVKEDTIDKYCEEVERI